MFGLSKKALSTEQTILLLNQQSDEFRQSLNRYVKLHLSQHKSINYSELALFCAFLSLYSYSYSPSFDEHNSDTYILYLSRLILDQGCAAINSENCDSLAEEVVRPRFADYYQYIELDIEKIRKNNLPSNYSFRETGRYFLQAGFGYSTLNDDCFESKLQEIGKLISKQITASMKKWRRSN